MRVTITGVDELIEALRKQDQRARQGVEKAVMAGAEILREEVELRAPRDTGALATEGFTEKVGYKTANSINALVTITDRKFEYAFYNEFGVAAHGQPARPFIRPAFDAKKDEVKAEIEGTLRAIFR